MPWLITPEALDVILFIMEERIKNGQLSDEEIETQLRGSRRDKSSSNRVQASGNIGVLSLQGPIFGRANMMTDLSGATSLEMFRDDLRAMVGDSTISSIIMDIDSPGGGSDLVSEVGQEIFDSRSKKPIYAIANGAAGSAAFWLMSQAEKTYSTPSGMVGSVGAYTVHEDQSAKDRQDGRKFTIVSAGPYKTEGNKHEPLTEEGRNYRQEIITELYDDFVNAVARGRGVDSETVKANYGGGRMITPKNALASGMIDGIMSFEELISHVSNTPQHVTVVGADGQSHAAVISDGQIRLEHKEEEHSEPGTGSPPLPRTDESGRDDPAIVGGWRRDTPSDLDPNVVPPTPNPGRPNSNVSADGVAAVADINAMQFSDGGREVSALTPEELAELRQLLGIGTDANVLSAVKSALAEVTQLKAAVNLSNEEQRFATEYPAVWAEHQKLIGEGRTNGGKTFAESISKIMHPSGEGLKATSQGLSSLASDTITQLHVKFASGQGGLEDFEKAISVITQGGIVDYGEYGSSRAPEVPTVVSNVNTIEGSQQARRVFAAKIAEIQAEDNLEYKAATQEAIKRHPELARAYLNAVPMGN